MKKAKTFQVILFVTFGIIQILGQTVTFLNGSYRISGIFQFNSAQQPCITHDEYLVLEKQCAENINLLGLVNYFPRIQSPVAKLNWPIQAASGFSDCDYYFIGAYVDQNTATGMISDFDCGTNTYDGHHGTDIAIWPYGFYKMDNSQVEVIAAAPGTIVQKADGNFDRNCASSTLTANSIIIQHADGSQALYWHMKKNSLTSKSVGQTVVSGEFLGIVGSSGSSSGPHLHFEVWAGSSNTTYKDPFSGNCNTLNAISWWNTQKPHTNPAVIKVSVNTTDIVLPACPATETPNESSIFTIPFQGKSLPAGYAKFYIFLRDELTGLNADCKILNPNGTVFNSWLYTSAANNKIYFKGYSKLLPVIPGVYTFQATYNGVKCSTAFTIQSITDVDDYNPNSLVRFYPNPSNGKIILTVNNSNRSGYISEIVIFNLTGQIIYKQNILSDINKTEFDLTSGIYIYAIKNRDGKTLKSGKLAIE